MVASLAPLVLQKHPVDIRLAARARPDTFPHHAKQVICNGKAAYVACARTLRAAGEAATRREPANSGRDQHLPRGHEYETLLQVFLNLLQCTNHGRKPRACPIQLISLRR